MSLEFKNLPLVHVAAKMVPVPPLDANLDQMFKISEQMQEILPTRNFSNALRKPPGLEIFQVAMGQPFGVELTGSIPGLRLTLQPDVFDLEWIKPDNETDAQYPRYGGVMRPILERAVMAFGTVLGSPTFEVANMTYTNLVRVEESSLAGLQEYLHIDASFPKAQPIHAAEFSWIADNDKKVDARITVRPTADQAGAAPTGFLVTTAAGQRFPRTTDVITHVDLVHEFLQVLFRSLLTPRAEQEWQLTN